MIINKDLCSGCGKCVAECPRAAIVCDNIGNYYIDFQLCNECDDIFEIECIRVCALNAITKNDGTYIDFDPIWRFRSEHLIWLMAIMGSRGSGRFQSGSKEWDAFRRLISAAYLDPELKVRMTRNFDDNCTGCPSKQNPGHVQRCGRADDLCYEKLGIKPGTVMRLWDVIKLVEDTFSIPFIKQLGTIPDDVLGDFLSFVSNDAKLFEN